MWVHCQPQQAAGDTGQVGAGKLRRLFEGSPEDSNMPEIDDLSYVQILQSKLGLPAEWNPAEVCQLLAAVAWLREDALRELQQQKGKPAPMSIFDGVAWNEYPWRVPETSDAEPRELSMPLDELPDALDVDSDQWPHEQISQCAITLHSYFAPRWSSARFPFCVSGSEQWLSLSHPSQ